MFGGEVDETAEVEFDDVDRPATPQVAAPAAGSKAAAAEGDAALLDGVAGVVIAQLPPMAAECIDAGAARQWVQRALGPVLADYAAGVRRQVLSELTGDRAKMQAELDDLRTRRKEFEAKRDEQKATLLSEQRQRRALSDRNRDLEAKIDELAGEIEQHKLTIASLMNKMRVAEVTEGDSDILREDLERKDAENRELKERIAQLEAEVAAAASAAAAAEEAPAQPRRRRGRPRKDKQGYNPEDDTTADLDSVDWLLPGGVPAGHTPIASDPDFGYQPPKHAPEPDSDAQLTLF